MSQPLTVEQVLEQYRGRPVSDLEAAWRELVDKNDGIRAQLGNQNRTDANGRRLSGREWSEWRDRAAYALKCGLTEQRILKEALKTARRRFNDDTPIRPGRELATPDALIHAAYAVLRRLAAEVEVDAEEQAVIDALDRWLRESGRVGT